MPSLLDTGVGTPAALHFNNDFMKKYNGDLQTVSFAYMQNMNYQMCRKHQQDAEKGMKSYGALLWQAYQSLVERIP